MSLKSKIPMVRTGNYSSLSVVWVCLLFLPLRALDCLDSLCGRCPSSHIISAFRQCSTSYPSGHPASCQSLYASCWISSSRFVSVPCIVLSPFLLKSMATYYTGLLFFLSRKFFRQRASEKTSQGSIDNF